VGRGLMHTRNRGNQPPPQAAGQQRGGCPEPGTHLQAVLRTCVTASAPPEPASSARSSARPGSTGHRWK
jgi:hypothetical protein